MQLYEKPSHISTRWASFENPGAEKGAGAKENLGGKGRCAQAVRPGETVELLNCRGPGVIRRIWMTVDNRSPAALRSLLIEMYWDGAERPAVAAPLGDFFGMGASDGVRFASDLFENPEGRSFNCFVPMPFKTGARVTFTNPLPERVTLFYDIDFTVGDEFTEKTMYFHAHWHREKTKLARDFEILPAVRGAGRYLGANVTVVENPAYPDAWFGEGEVKIYLDGDGQWPTLAGTGTEDYIGTAWGMGTFAGRYQGCPYHDGEKREWAFYRYHIVDPVYFDEDCRVTIQQMGGAPGEVYRKIAKGDAPQRMATLNLRDGTFVYALADGGRAAQAVPWEGQWCNFYREDDVAACAYFYLDRPENGLPAIQAVGVRAEGRLD